MRYYNDNDPNIIRWLESLCSSHLIGSGTIDDRNIKDVESIDLIGFTRCHFFAGIGGWEYALQLAGWPKDRPVWTGSCPCQPFSAAGKGWKEKDPRHLWPDFRRLIAECRPPTILGEQVASKAGYEWFTGIRADLEGMGYAVGSADLCAASQGAPHIRQRLYWVADSAYPNRRRGIAPKKAGVGQKVERRRGLVVGCENVDFWRNYDECVFEDGKRRRIESRLEPLANGIPGRMAQIRGLGNAIVPQVAAIFIQAFLECESCE